MATARSIPRELFLAPQHATSATPLASRVRSTLLSASLTGLRELGWEHRYFRALPTEMHMEMRTIPASSWLPLETAHRHYSACDRMGLSSEDMRAMGKAVSVRTQQTFVGTLSEFPGCEDTRRVRPSPLVVVGSAFDRLHSRCAEWIARGDRPQLVAPLRSHARARATRVGHSLIAAARLADRAPAARSQATAVRART